jgi:hypothetical protein
MNEIVPYSVARAFAIDSKFATIKEYTDFVTSANLVGYPASPTVYREYTSAHDFLGKTTEEYKAGKYVNAVKNRDQEAMTARMKSTWANRRELKKTLNSQPVAPAKTVEATSSQFTAEEVIDILVSSNASRLYIAEFIEQNKVNPVFAVETLLKLYKSELVEAG